MSRCCRSFSLVANAGLYVTITRLKADVHFYGASKWKARYMLSVYLVANTSLYKARPHQQRYRSHIVEATGNFVVCCFDIVANVDRA